MLQQDKGYQETVMTSLTCACGCGGDIKYNALGRPRKFLPGHDRKNQRRTKHLVIVHGSNSEVIKYSVSARNNIEAASKAVARAVPLDVITERIEVNGEVIYPREDWNNRTGPPNSFKSQIQYMVGINTQRLLMANIEDRERGNFVDEAIMEKLKKDLGVEL